MSLITEQIYSFFPSESTVPDLTLNAALSLRNKVKKEAKHTQSVIDLSGQLLISWPVLLTDLILLFSCCCRKLDSCVCRDDFYVFSEAQRNKDVFRFLTQVLINRKNMFVGCFRNVTVTSQFIDDG